MAEEIQFGRMTYNARQWADYFYKTVIERTNEDKYALALARIARDAQKIVREYLENAIDATEEYDRLRYLRDELLAVFWNALDPNSNNYILNVGGGVIDLDEGALTVAGTVDDYFEGVMAAWEELDLKPSGPLEQRAAYWRNVVWEDDHLYQITMRARANAWGDKVPYWYWIDRGTGRYPGAYPDYGPTGFLDVATFQIQQLFDEALFEVENEEYNLVEQAYTRFILDPENYEVGDVLGEFYKDGRRYRIYITPTKRLGVAQRPHEYIRRYFRERV